MPDKPPEKAKKTPNKPTVAAAIEPDVLAVIDRRAGDLETTRSKFLAGVLNKWADEGYPPISKLDKAAMSMADDDEK